MEPLQTNLFQINNPEKIINGFEKYTASDMNSTSMDMLKPIITDIDHHMLDIVAAYIRRLPDNKTRKQIARLMINSIIKSSNL